MRGNKQFINILAGKSEKRLIRGTNCDWRLIKN
jgi:hypothetical protein